MSNYGTCPYCHSNIIHSQFGINQVHELIECPCCGRFEIRKLPFQTGKDIKDEIASYLYYHSDDKFLKFLGDKDLYESDCDHSEDISHVSREEILAFQPKSFAERIDMILLEIAKKSNYIGEKIVLSKEKVYSLLFIKRHDEEGNLLKKEIISSQLHEITDYLEENKYTENYYQDSPVFILKPEGWKRVDELQKHATTTSKTAFVAMSFAKEMRPVEETIKSAITKCNFVPMIIKDKEYNRQIVPEILHEIRQARFVIAEFTNHNNGAYYEAGYAFALGKEVIHLCNDESFEQDAHFDVKQVNTIRWKTPEDLEEKLIKRIKATIS